ncbi:hypothetical protein [Phocaeicola barnesiae]|uniref:Uncharacterized protein n=1 Tax=Phocaeicola barnesiae TaxID=376804 RepID=A0AAW5MWB6_9BACT|nr:hypothetical protein [Phocaeicola barnesiae]MCR8872751.1 hypothetical protein [Phocaeicola barnesiae]
MDEKNLINAASGYAAGNAVSNSVINNLRKYSEEAERKLAHWTSEETISAEIAKFILSDNKQGAFEYLNAHFNEEIVDAAQRQKDYIYSLETIIQKRKDKFLPFYQKIGMDMPEQLKNITADQLCEILGVTNLHIIDSTDGKTSPSHSSDGENLGLIFRAIIIIGMIILIIIGLL